MNLQMQGGRMPMRLRPSPSRSRWQIFPAVVFLVACFPPDALAMHITEGILPLHWAALWLLGSIPFLIIGLRDLKARSQKTSFFKPLVGLVGAAVFVISCMPIPVPTAGTSSHPCGTGLSAILIGPWLTTVIASIALLLQALFLAHGGLTTLGANIVSMGIAGGLSGYATFRMMRKLGTPLSVASFLAGLISDWATYAATSFQLASALHGSGSLSKMFLTIIIAFCPTQIPLGILEGFLTAGCIVFIQARRPEFFDRLACPTGGRV